MINDYTIELANLDVKLIRENGRNKKKKNRDYLIK